MSRAHNNDFFIDTGLLRDHVSKLREERKNASRLYAYVSAMKNCADPSVAHTYNSVLRDIDRLIKYLDKMADVLSDAEYDAERLSDKLGALIEHDTAHAHHTISRSLML